MAWTVANRREVIPVGKIGNLKQRTPALAQTAVEVVIDGSMRVEVYTGTQARSCFDERHFRSGTRQSIRRDAPTGSAAHYTSIENLT